MKEWMKLIPEAELRTYQRAGFLTDQRLGHRSALIVVDVTYGFTGSEGATLEQAIGEFPTACGPSAWEAMPRIARLIGLFRERNLPIVFTHSDPVSTRFAGNATKSHRRLTDIPKFNDFPPAILPRNDEWVLTKAKASGFFQTALTAYLIKERVDTLIVCGVSTSGCVRATAVDGFSHGFATFIIDDCCFDRSYFSHCVNLFDLHAKYASVVSLGELEAMMPLARKATAA